MAQFGCGVAQLGCGVAQLGCGVAQKGIGVKAPLYSTVVTVGCVVGTENIN